MKIFAAYHAAVSHKGRPTVILAQTKKGYGMGSGGQGKMTTHQQKKLDDEALLAFRDRFALPISDDDVTHLRFVKPAEDTPEMKYLHARRQALGGYVPARKRSAETFRCRRCPVCHACSTDPVNAKCPPPWYSSMCRNC